MSKSSIYLGTDLLDFNGVINVKRQVNDYRDTNIGSSNKSYTLELPNTPNNTLLLELINDIRSRGEVTDLARIVMNGIEAIRGKLRIISFADLFTKAIVEADDWVDDIKGVSIRDLSWVGGDAHIFTAANVLASWTAGAGANYRYPLINFAELYSEDTGAGAKIYPYDLYPIWNIENIVRKIFSDSGYTVAANSFFDGAAGQALYIESVPVHAEPDFITEKAMKAYVTNATDNRVTDAAVDDGDPFSLSLGPIVLDMGSEQIDEGGDYNTGTNRYVAPLDGTYRFQGQIQVNSQANDGGADYDVTENTITWSIDKNGTPLNQFTDTELDPPEPTLFDGEPVFTLDTGWVYLEAGDYIEINVILECFGTNESGGTTDIILYVKNGVANSFLTVTWDERNLWPGIGQTFAPGVYLPDMDTVALLKGLKEAYNLRFLMDRNNRTIYIETSDDFYGDTEVDWSDKIDYSEEPSFEIVVFGYEKEQKFKWKPDTNDKAYSNYVAENGVPFQKILTLESQYAKPGSKTRENSQFSPTIVGNMNQIGHFSGKVPRIFGSEDFVSETKPYPPYRPKKWLPRLFEWKGMIALTTGSFNWHEEIEDSTGTAYTTFPSVETPDMSDVFDAYWLKDFRRIDRNKLVTPVLKIKPYEFIPFTTVVGTPANEGFRAKYKLNINGQDMFYIISRITMDGDRVKCEFMQKT